MAATPDLPVISKPPLPVLQKGHKLAQGLCGAWLFTESGAVTTNASGKVYTIYDYSGYQNSGSTITGASAVAAQWVGSPGGMAMNCVYTPGATNECRVEIPSNSKTLNLNSVILTGQFSFSMWLRIASNYVSGYAYLLSFPAYQSSGNLEPFTFRLNSTSNLEMTTTGAGATITNGAWTTFPSGSVPNWFHATVVVDTKGGKVYIYYNGKLVQQGTVTGTWSEGTLDTMAACIGGSGSAINSRGWTGYIDSVLMWQRALGADDVRMLFLDQYAAFRQPSILRTAAAAITGKGSTLLMMGVG